MSAPARPTRGYRGEPRATRFHVAARWATAPLGPLERLVPSTGRILDWGCGHGLFALWLAQRAPGREVHGVDLDHAKIEVARRAAEATPHAGRLSFETVAPGTGPIGTWDGVVIVDVLYLLDPDRQATAVAAAVDALAPGGAVVIKDMADRPRWKAGTTRIQERLAVGTLGITATEGTVHRPPGPERLASLLAEAGLATEIHRLDRGYHCPHVAVVGRHPDRSDRVLGG